jgi:hypothetical protein
VQKLQAPFLAQQMAPLPKLRVITGDAFETTGLDFFGPLYVGIGRGQIIKHWGAIFTCLTMRAVHLELVEHMDTDSFINSLIRFRNRKGNPREIWCDNGTNFTGAAKEIEKWMKSWNKADIDSKTKPFGITWHFNPPEISHHGGVFESLIRPCRRILGSLTNNGSTIPSREVLTTLLTEVGRIMNHRPLCTVSNDPKDLETLTPAMLLHPKTDLMSIPPGLEEVARYYRYRWRLVQHLGDVFWLRWKK